MSAKNSNNQAKKSIQINIENIQSKTILNNPNIN
jgi:hypothetical protein